MLLPSQVAELGLPMTSLAQILPSLAAVSAAAAAGPRQEKPKHILYLNKFRTQQCAMFLEHKCQYHRPYTCFDWHFPNQKRRQPVKQADGTFNYNPDVYCTKYDENTGICSNGDECLYVHRNAGDTERRYHPRYFKTGNCIYETTEAGACAKNGQHCAFAHGQDDIRLPVYDIREVQHATQHSINLPASLEKERVLSEDPQWNDMLHVLACYKTEACKKPPRMCRQGYACPFYHNGKDKRRNPRIFRYRSTPCPQVKPGDEWKDSTQCDAGDNCSYCHTRTEQQFHPEIYKSTKCNDMVHNGYCPRGPFCAFAHVDTEMSIGRDFLATAPPLEDGSVTELDNEALNAIKASLSISEQLNERRPESATSSIWNSDSHRSPSNEPSHYSRSSAIGGGGSTLMDLQNLAAFLPTVMSSQSFWSVPSRPSAFTTADQQSSGLITSSTCGTHGSTLSPAPCTNSSTTLAQHKGRHRSGGSLSSESGLSSSSARGDTPPFFGGVDGISGWGSFSPAGGNNRSSAYGSIGRGQKKYGNGSLFSGIFPSGGNQQDSSDSVSSTVVDHDTHKWHNDETHHVESIMGHALGDSYNFSSRDLCELDSWPDEHQQTLTFQNQPTTTSGIPTSMDQFTVSCSSPHNDWLPYGGGKAVGSNLRSAPVSIPRPSRGGGLSSCASSGLGGSPYSQIQGGGLDQSSVQSMGFTPGLPRSRHTSTGTAGSPQAVVASNSFTNLPQSPIMAASPFNNPSCDLERLQLERDLADFRSQLTAKKEEIDIIKIERDQARGQLRESLHVIQSLVQHLGSNNGGVATSTGQSPPVASTTDDLHYKMASLLIDVVKHPELLSNSAWLDPAIAKNQQQSIQTANQTASTVVNSGSSQTINHQSQLAASSSGSVTPVSASSN